MKVWREWLIKTCAIFPELINGEWTLLSSRLHCSAWHIVGLDRELGCTTETTFNDGTKTTFCTCDTSFCNADPPDLNGFSCYAGDLELDTIDQAYLNFYFETRSELSYTIASCYKNRDQCFQMRYFGVTGPRIRFGCSPLGLAGLAPSDQFSNSFQWSHLTPVDQFNRKAILGVKTCDTPLCNLPEGIGTEEAIPEVSTTTLPVTIKEWGGFSYPTERAKWIFKSAAQSNTPNTNLPLSENAGCKTNLLTYQMYLLLFLQLFKTTL